MQPSKDIPADLGMSGPLTSSDALRPWVLVIWILALAPVLAVISTPRAFDVPFSNYIPTGAGQQGMIPWLIGKVTTYFILTMAIILIASYKRRSRAERSVEERKLLAPVIVYSLAPLLVTLAVSKGRPTLAMLGLPVVFTATYFLPSVRPGTIAKHIRIALASVYIYGTILAVIIAPKWAMEYDYSTDTSYFGYRLYGMAVHANILAASLFLFIVLGWVPGARLKKEKLHVLLALIMVIAAQSKTVILILLIAFSLKIFSAFLRKVYSRKALRYSFIFSFFGIIYFALRSKTVLDKIHDPKLMSLTGRVPIWLITYSLWLKRPWFGYGTDMWNPAMQTDYARFLGGFLAPHAHNQLLQTLGETGIVGAALLLIVYYSFGKASLKLSSLTGGVSLFLFASLLFRSITEVPIALVADQSNFFAFWAIFAIFVSCYKYRAYTARASGDVVT